MRGWVVLLVLTFWACAERDNPYDPANRAARNTDTGAKLPSPHPGVKVVLLDSAGRDNNYGRDSNHIYDGTIESALSRLDPGDTLWVQGGRTYPTFGLSLMFGGARLLPVVIRSFGGEARVLARSRVQNLLTIQTGGVNVHIQGFAFVGAIQPAIIAVDVPGDIWIDSCRVDTSYFAIEMRNVTGTVHIHDVTMTADSLVPPVSFQNIGFLDTARLVW